MRINTNLMAINAQRNLWRVDLELSKSMEKLSSGLRINRASDDAGGLAISEAMRAKIRGTAQAEKNAQDGIGLLNTAEGAMDQVHGMLQRMRELAVQAANGTLTDTQREAIDVEFQELKTEIDRLATATDFNGVTLLDGSLEGTPLTLQVGPDQGDTLDITVDEVTTTALGASDVDISLETVATQTDAQDAITALDAAIDSLSLSRARVGAATNRLEYAIQSLQAGRENLAAAESRIRDVDMASEMSNLTKNQILLQSATAMLAQAHAVPQNVLSLLR